MGRDVSLTLRPDPETSILNILPGRVVSWQGQGTTQLQVLLETSQDLLLARVTRKSRENLALEPGKEVFIQVKSLTFMV